MVTSNPVMNDETHPPENVPEHPRESPPKSSADAPETTSEDGRRFVALTERQQTTVATALTIVSAVVILFAVLGAGGLVAAFVGRFSSVLLPLVVGGVAALVVNPYYRFLRERLRLPTALALAAIFLSVLLPTAAFLWFFGALLVEQISEMATKFPEWYASVKTQLQERWPRFLEFLDSNPWAQSLRQVVEEQQDALVAGLQSMGGRALSAGAGLLGAVGTLFSWAVMPVYFIFFLVAPSPAREGLEEYLPFFKPETRKHVVYLVDEFVEIVVAFFRGQLVIAFLQGVLYAIGFTIVGLKYGFVLGLVLGFLNIIPYLGSIIGLGSTIPLAYFQTGGGPGLVLAVLIVFSVVQMIEGYVLTPRIMGDKTGLHPVVIIFAIFFWGSALGGIMGMILAIPLTAFLVVFWRLAKENYIQELV